MWCTTTRARSGGRCPRTRPRRSTSSSTVSAAWRVGQRARRQARSRARRRAAVGSRSCPMSPTSTSIRWARRSVTSARSSAVPSRRARGPPRRASDPGTRTISASTRCICSARRLTPRRKVNSRSCWTAPRRCHSPPTACSKRSTFSAASTRTASWSCRSRRTRRERLTPRGKVGGRSESPVKRVAFHVRLHADLPRPASVSSQLVLTPLSGRKRR
mmetsp:Transcript_11863/g.37602  ORF Transcript_11863/g.37602 Transcript_11863/m.37602 type:complete len:216 (+) Transcript_11863:639-1286(+)